MTTEEMIRLPILMANCIAVVIFIGITFRLRAKVAEQRRFIDDLTYRADMLDHGVSGNANTLRDLREYAVDTQEKLDELGYDSSEWAEQIEAHLKYLDDIEFARRTRRKLPTPVTTFDLRKKESEAAKQLELEGESVDSEDS